MPMIRGTVPSGHMARMPGLLPLLVGLMLITASCGDTDSTTESTAAAAVGVTVTSVTTATSDTESATTTTVSPVAEEGGEIPQPRIGYQVAGVAADDVLNVRAGPSAQDEIVGTLAPNATGVVVTDTDPGTWWGVMLDDGTEGWVNSSYLAVDDAWTAPFSKLPCAAEDVGWGESQLSPKPTEASDTDFVHGYDYLTSPQCDRLVIRLATRNGTARPPDWPSIAAATIPGGVEVTSGSNRVIVTFPKDYFEIRWAATQADFEEAQLLVVSPLEAPTKRAVELLYGSEQIAHARFLDDPARIVIDVKPAPDPTGLDYSPSIHALWILTEPVLWDGSLPGTQQPITVTGFGRPYEGWGYASLTRLDGDSDDVEALWDGGYDCANEDSQGGPGRGDWYCFTAAFDVWGEFSFTIDELPLGSYRLSLEDECAGGDEVDCDEFVMYYDFTVSATEAATATTAPSTILFSAGDPPLSPPPALPGGGVASGSGCSPGAGDLPDGVWFGSVVDRSAGAIEFDLACWYFLDAATSECSEHGEPVEDGYCVINENPTLRTITIDPGVPVHVLEGGSADLAAVSFADWPPEYPGYDRCPSSGCILWLYVNAGEVTEMVEQYTP